MKSIPYVILFATLFSLACGGTSQESTQKTEPQTPLLVAPEFNADSAYMFIQQQVNFGPRIPGTKAHHLCAEFLHDKLTQYGAKVILQEAPLTTHDGRKYTLENIIASYQPEKKERILVSAHWDARPLSDQDLDLQAPFDAANDGGSGVGIILEMARLLQKQHPTLGVDFILWDLEDYGKANDHQPNEPTWCLGSQYWQKHPHQAGYKARYAINLDMVGGEYAQFTQDEVSRKYAPEVIQKIWTIGQNIGYSSYFPNQPSGSIIDDHFWINQAGIPCVDIIHFSNDVGFYRYWHTQKDNMAGIDKHTLKAVGQTILEVIYREKQ